MKAKYYKIKATSDKDVTLLPKKYFNYRIAENTIRCLKSRNRRDYIHNNGEIQKYEICTFFGDFKASEVLTYDDYLFANQELPYLNELSRLIISAEVWNDFYNFKPDFNNKLQAKWCPVFKNKDGKIYYETSALFSDMYLYLGKICFGSNEVSEEFAMKFKELFEEILK